MIGYLLTFHFALISCHNFTFDINVEERISYQSLVIFHHFTSESHTLLYKHWNVSKIQSIIYARQTIVAKVLLPAYAKIVCIFKAEHRMHALYKRKLS